MMQIQSGSRAFFSGMEGFEPKDNDVVIIDDNPVGYVFKRNRWDAENKCCQFFIARVEKHRLMKWEISHGKAMCLGHYLLPDFANEFGITVSDLEILRPLRDRMDRRHSYLVVIYDAYLENGSMTLTDEQRTAAYIDYLQSRGLNF